MTKVFSGHFTFATTVIMRAAVLLKYTGHHEQAITYFNYLLAIAPKPYNDFDLLLQLGSLYQLRGNNKKAAQHYAELLGRLKTYKRVEKDTKWDEWLKSPQFFDNFGAWDWSQSLRLALISNFPHRMRDLD